MPEEGTKGTNPLEPSLQAVNVSRGGTIIVRHVEWAGTSAQRRRGLLGRSGLDPEEGIYLAPCQWIHTFRMKFPIDVAFLARDGRVLAVHHSLKPNRLSKIALRAQGVLELSAGRLRATNTDVGDILQFREVDANS
jgi:uncharacterized membrane protein (UPF0127 family)